MTPSTNRKTSRFILVIQVAIITWFVYTLATAIHIRQTTGLLNITTSSKNAAITLSQVNKNANIVGTGSARLRLPAGTYLLAASDTKQNAVVVVTINTGKTTNQRLTLSSVTATPSADNIDISGIDGFTNRGLSSAQTDNLRQLFFEYKPAVQNIIINASGIQTGPYDPTGDVTVFSLLFTGSIDGKPLKGTVSYSDTTNVRLVIVDQSSGAQLYSGDSSLAPSAN